MSPPTSPKTQGRNEATETPKSSTNISPTKSNNKNKNSNPRVLKKDSIEAINRANVLASCKRSNAKPASRSSSFTIAERKKSLEMMMSTKSLNSHLSNDSLASTTSTLTGSRKPSREYDSAFVSRRSSKDNEDNSVEPVKEEETEVANKVTKVSDTKWSTLEKKYAANNKIDIGAKLEQFKAASSSGGMEKVPRDL